MAKKSERTTIALDREMFEQLARVAKKNDRSTSAEARLAIRRHVEAEAKQAA